MPLVPRAARTSAVCQWAILYQDHASLWTFSNERCSQNGGCGGGGGGGGGGGDDHHKYFDDDINQQCVNGQ